MGRETIRTALGAAIAGALPAARLAGFDGAPARPDRIGAGGLVELEGIEQGPTETDLSPVTYHKTAIFALVAAATTGEALGAMLTAIGAAIAADRTLGGTSEWTDADAGELGDELAAGSEGHFEARIPVSAEYSTTNPLE